MIFECELGGFTEEGMGALNDNSSLDKTSEETSDIATLTSSRWESFSAVRNKKGRKKPGRVGLHISQLPQEMLLKIFSEFRPPELSRTVAPVCRAWRDIAHDRTLWDEVAFNDTRGSTQQLIDMIRAKPQLRKISLTNRTDGNALLTEIIENTTRLESLTLNNCQGAPNRSNIKSKVMMNLLKKHKELKSIFIEGTDFRSCGFYRMLLPKISTDIKNLRLIIRPSKREWKVLSASKHVHKLNALGNN